VFTEINDEDVKEDSGVKTAEDNLEGEVEGEEGEDIEEDKGVEDKEGLEEDNKEDEEEEVDVGDDFLLY